MVDDLAQDEKVRNGEEEETGWSKTSYRRVNTKSVSYGIEGR